MRKVALLFPGQGAQYVGMGKAFYDRYPSARAIYEQADAIVGYALSQYCFEGPASKLTQTKYSQVAILTTSVAYLEVLKEVWEDAFSPYAVLGLSLGEYAALVASGVLSFSDALAIVAARGHYMDEASAQYPGGMLSVIGLTREMLGLLCVRVETEEGECCRIANLNCPGQVVLSGTKQAMECAAVLCQEAGAKKIIPLAVSGPFHTPLMENAAQKLAGTLDTYSLSKPSSLFVANANACALTDTKHIKASLEKQVCAPVLWEDSIRLVLSKECDVFIEVGPGKILKGLLRRIDKKVYVYDMDGDVYLEGLPCMAKR